MNDQEQLQSSYLLMRLSAYKALKWIKAGDYEKAADYLSNGISQTETALGLEPIDY